MGLDDEIKIENAGTSLEVQWLILCAPNAEGLGPIPSQRTRSRRPHLRVHMLQLKYLHVATKEPARHIGGRRSFVLQLRPGAAKQINIKQITSCLRLPRERLTQVWYLNA